MLESSYLCTRFQNGSSDKLDILIWTRCAGLPLFSFASLSQRETTRKKKIKKTSENIWKICLKVLTFASAFLKEKQR